MLSTRHDLKEVSTGEKNRNYEDIKKLKMNADYNSAKQRIYISDQMTTYFSPLHKIIPWYHKIAFEFLLSTAVVNSLVLYKQIKPYTKIVDFKKFIWECLCESPIIQDDGAAQSQGPSKTHFLQTYKTRDNRNRIIRKRFPEWYSKIQKNDGRQEAIKKN